MLNIVDDFWIFLMSHESSICSCRLVQFKWQCIPLLPSVLFLIAPSLFSTCRNHKLTQLLQDAIGGGAKASSNAPSKLHNFDPQNARICSPVTLVAVMLNACWTGLDVRELLPIAFHNQRDGRAVWKQCAMSYVGRVWNQKHCQANALKLANRAKNVVLATECGRKKCEEWWMCKIVKLD